MGDQMDEEPGGGSFATRQPDRVPVPGEPSEVDRPIFVVGCHRSGTSVLRRSLDSHPRISAGPEEGSVFWLAKDDNELGRSRREAYGVSDEEWLTMVRSMVETFQLRYAGSAGKTRWALKLPENALIIDFLDRLYPNCQVIHIVRDPRDVIASNSKKYGSRRDYFYGERWVQYVRAAETKGRLLGSERFHTLRYEDFVSDPESVLRSLVSWLGEPWSDDVLKISGRSHRYPATVNPHGKQTLEVVEQSDIRTDSIGRGKRERFSVALLYVRIRGNDLVEKFGYSIQVMP
jgi:Sulfotransferase family